VNRREAQPGDLLFFYQAVGAEVPLSRHGCARLAAHRAQWRPGWVGLSYGFVTDGPGTVKKGSASVLLIITPIAFGGRGSNKNLFGVFLPIEKILNWTTVDDPNSFNLSIYVRSPAYAA